MEVSSSNNIKLSIWLVTYHLTDVECSGLTADVRALLYSAVELIGSHSDPY